jgi:endonuclease/exonuclease/phosphatase family metal-dependent hydrolase
VTIVRRILEGLGWASAIALVVAFLVGYAAPYLSPARYWWTDLFAVGLPFMGVAVTILSVGLCGWGGYRRRWGRVVLGAGLLALLAVRFGPRLAAWGPAPADTDTLRLMTFNVPPSLPEGTASASPLVDLVQRTRPDVMAFQEVRLATGRDRATNLRRVSVPLRPLLEPPVGYVPPPRMPVETAVQQPVVSRGLLDSMSVHPLPPDGESNSRARYTRTSFSWKGRTAVLYNVHLHSIGEVRPWTVLSEGWASLSRWRAFLRTYRKAALRRAQQARLIRRRIQEESRPVLVLGDFNSTPHQWAYRHLAQGLQSAVHRRVRGWGTTFPAQRPLVQIDHVLAGPAWEITVAHIPADEAGAVSDHRPVVAHLRWRTE